MAEKKDDHVKQQTKGNEPEENKELVALKHVKTHMYWSLGAGLIPIPLLDLAAVAGVQLKLLNRLAGHYEADFSENLGKSFIAALVGTLTAHNLRRGVVNSFLKSVPVVGALGALSMPLFSGAATYAIGKVFIQHFESGGTFLDFNPKKVKAHFAQLFEDGKLKASEVKAK